MGIIKNCLYKSIPYVGIFYWGKQRLPVIYYHDIVEEAGESLQKTNVRVYRSHMEYLAGKQYKTLLFHELEEVLRTVKRRRDKYVLITFDDGYRSNYLKAFPIMKELGLKFNIFINTGRVEKEEPDFLTISMIKEMYESKLVEFGSHTHSHIDAGKATGKELIREIKLCNERIMNWLGYQAEDFCYPYGFYTNRTNRLLSRYYKRIYTSDCRPIEKIRGAKLIGRIGISADDGIKELNHKLKGNYDILYLYYRRHNLKRRKKEGYGFE